MRRLLSVRLVALVVAALAVLGIAIPAVADHDRPFQGRADVVIVGVEPLPPFPPERVRLTGSADRSVGWVNSR